MNNKNKNNKFQPKLEHQKTRSEFVASALQQNKKLEETSCCTGWEKHTLVNQIVCLGLRSALICFWILPKRHYKLMIILLFSPCETFRNPNIRLCWIHYNIYAISRFSSAFLLYIYFYLVSWYFKTCMTAFWSILETDILLLSICQFYTKHSMHPRGQDHTSLPRRNQQT